MKWTGGIIVEDGAVLMTMADIRREFGFPLDAIAAAVAMTPRVQQHGHDYMRRGDVLKHMLNAFERRLAENREIVEGRKGAGLRCGAFEQRVKIYERRCAMVRAAMEGEHAGRTDHAG